MTEMIWPRIDTDRRGCLTWAGQTVFSLVSAYICADPRLKSNDYKDDTTVVKTITSLPVLWLVVVCFGITGNADECSAASEVGYTIPRHLEWSFTLQNTTNQVSKQVQLWTYAPVPLTATQQRIQVDASHPFEERSDEAGNSILHFTLLDIPPYATKIITIRVDLLLSDTPLPIEAGTPSPNPSHQGRGIKSPLPSREGLGEGEQDVTSYLHPEPSCESDDPDIQQRAKHLTATEPVETAENIFRWVAENIEYTGYLKHPRGARYALEHKKGDCTEFMYLFVALCRAAGIPARGVGGYVYAKNAILKPADYHNWAEFYVDGVWHLADPQRNVFMQKQSHYLVMRVIGAVSDDHPMQQYRRFRYTGEGLKVRMN